MKAFIVFFMSLITVSMVYAETVYKTVDAEGNTIFSDVPSEGAEEIVIQELQTTNFPKVKPFKYRPPEEKEIKFQYTTLRITTPEHDSTIQNQVGNVNISIDVKPTLTKADELVLFMDGKQILTGKTPQFALANIDRGTHSINVAVMDKENKILKRSEVVVFHVRRRSVLSSKLAEKISVESQGSTSDSETTTTGSQSTDISVP